MIECSFYLQIQCNHLIIFLGLDLTRWRCRRRSRRGRLSGRRNQTETEEEQKRKWEANAHNRPPHFWRELASGPGKGRLDK